MSKLYKTINDIWKISDIGSILLGMISVNALGMFFLCFEDLFTEYETLDYLSGFFIGFSVLSIMMPYFMISAIIRDYKLILSMPIEAAKLPQVMSITVDISLAATFIMDVIFLAASGMALRIPAYAGATLFIAILVHIGVCGFISTGVMNTAFYTGNSPKGFIKGIVYFIFVMAAFIVKIVTISLEYENFESRNAQIVSIVILAVMLVLFVLFRAVTAKELRSRMRLEKVYKKRKIKEPKEESYV